jgi:membrane fusion protein, heavy metal efflux system
MMTGRTLTVVLVAIVGLGVAAAGTWFASPTVRAYFGDRASNDPGQAAHADHDGHEGHDDDKECDGHEGGDDAESAAQLSAEQMRRIGLKLAKAGPGKIGTRLRLPGEIVVNADRTAHIVPRAAGLVRQVLKSVGDAVTKDEVLVLLESAELGEAKVDYLSKLNQAGFSQLDRQRAQAVHDNTLGLLKTLKGSPSLDALKKVPLGEMGENRSKLVSAYAEVMLAKTTYVREKGLFERKVGSESDYLAAENSYKKAEADYLATCDSVAFEIKRTLLEQRRSQRLAQLARAAAERRLYVLGLTSRDLKHLADAAGVGEPTKGKAKPAKTEATGEKLAWYALRAPFGGTVIERHATLGEKLGDDANVFTVADLSTVWVNLSVYQKDLVRLRKGQGAQVSSEGLGATARGKIIYVAPIIDHATRSGLVRVLLANPDGRWRPGLFVTAQIDMGQANAAVVAPKDALQRLDNEIVVFVRDEHGFEARPVKIGRSNATHVEILSGLSVGQKYVVRGAFELKARIITSGLDPHAGHGH